MGSRAKIKTDKGITDNIEIKKGSKQGDKISAIIFCVVIAMVFMITEEEVNSGFRIGGETITSLEYSDDSAIMSEELELLQKFIDRFVVNCNKVGLKIHIGKTKSMTTNKMMKDMKITINGKKVETVTKFLYLGHKITYDNDGKIALDHRIGLGWAAFQKNEKILASKVIPLTIKVKIYKTYILPVILYGANCITWKENLLQKLEVFQNDMMRYMIGVKRIDKVTIEDLRQRCRIDPVSDIVKDSTLKLYNKIKASVKGVAKLCFEGMVEGKRSRGRPKQRWRDNVMKWKGFSSWKDLLQNT